MARRRPYGLHAVLDQASVLPLSTSPSAPISRRRHPSPSPEIGEWRHGGERYENPLSSPVNPSVTASPASNRSSFSSDKVSSPILTGGATFDDQGERPDNVSSSPQTTAETAPADSPNSVDHVWSATWHSRDAEMWHDRVSPRRTQSLSSASHWSNRRPTNSPGDSRAAAAAADESEWRSTRARESTATFSNLRSRSAAEAETMSSSIISPASLKKTEHKERDKLATAGSASIASQRRNLQKKSSDRQSTSRRPERPLGFSNRQASAILGRVSSRTGSSVESGSRSASPEVSSSSSGTSGLLFEEITGGLDGHGWRQWTKELADALDESLPLETVTSLEKTEPISLSQRERSQTGSLGKADSMRPHESVIGRFAADTNLLRSISLDRGIGETDKGPVSGIRGEQYSGKSVEEASQTTRLFHSASAGHGIGQAFGNTRSHLAPEANVKPTFLQGDAKYLEINPALASPSRSIYGKLSKETEGSSWVARREESQMKASLKNISRWLEMEGAKVIARMPMSTREMALVLRQVAEGTERHVSTEAESFSSVKANSLRKNGETLMEVFERQVAARNDHASQLHSRQVMMRALEEAQTLLEEAIASHQMQSKRRVNVFQDILPSVRQTAVSRFRGNVSGYLSKGALQKMQEELVQEIESLAEAMGDRVRGSVGQPSPMLR